MSRPAEWLVPDWGIDQVGALMTTRAGGASAAPFASMNLGDAVGDDAAAVRANRDRLAVVVGSEPFFLRQVHRDTVVRAGPGQGRHAVPVEADASLATEPGVACTVLVADCLPVLFAAPAGRAVAAAHAGWRGLAAGVVEKTLIAVAEAASCEPGEVSVWLGPCIGPAAFEVGADVLRAFGRAPEDTGRTRFKPGRPGHWLADLPGLATDRLRAAGARLISGGTGCTVAEPSRFFSFRRDGVTGRMAAAVWIRPAHKG